MLALEDAQFWMSGNWLRSLPVPAGADSGVDAVGTGLLIGQTVKLVGVVTAIDLFSNKYHDITVMLTQKLVIDQNNYTSAPNLTVPGYRTVIKVPASVLVVGT